MLGCDTATYWSLQTKHMTGVNNITLYWLFFLIYKYKVSQRSSKFEIDTSSPTK
jgi:hypothetical protein